MERLLISACLLGRDCKYDGGNNRLPQELLDRLRENFDLTPVCPETAGGLEAPREPSERLGDKVVGRSGRDVTAQFVKGAETALALAERFNCRWALMKERSPSCGSGRIYDGSFTGAQVEGDGVATQALKEKGLIVFGESEAELLIQVAAGEEKA